VQPCPSILSAREGGSDGKAAKPSDTAKVGRRGFLAGAAAASGGAGMTTPSLAGPGGLAGRPRATLPLQLAAAEREPPAAADALTNDRSGSDDMMDVLKALPIEYMASNPGSTFRGRHQSFINYGGDKAPELLACCHEETSVGIAQGYAKTTGRPMAALVYGTVGLQHAALAIDNAFCDRVSMVVRTGNAGDAHKRRPGVEWAHGVQDGAALARDFTKWDDQPGSLGRFGDSLLRAYALATTPPMARVPVAADTELQEGPVGDGATPAVPKLAGFAMPAGDPRAVQEGARLQGAAENLVWMRALAAGAAFILAIEPVDLWGARNRFRDQLVRTGAQLHQPAGDMPPCGDKVLSDRQITDIIAFLKTVPRPPAVASIPLLH
jgi:acetolactate synthase-1/2/3 large subunit